MHQVSISQMGRGTKEDVRVPEYEKSKRTQSAGGAWGQGQPIKGAEERCNPSLLGLGEAAACSHQEFLLFEHYCEMCVAQLGPQELICETWTVTNTLAMHLGAYVIPGLPVVCGKFY